MTLFLRDKRNKTILDLDVYTHPDDEKTFIKLIKNFFTKMF